METRSWHWLAFRADSESVRSMRNADAGHAARGWTVSMGGNISRDIRIRGISPGHLPGSARQVSPEVVGVLEMAEGLVMGGAIPRKKRSW